jgi:hypothetical protein
MLRCAGCDEIVSAWAARCPHCHRSTDDAVELPDERPIGPEETTGGLQGPDPPGTANHTPSGSGDQLDASSRTPQITSRSGDQLDAPRPTHAITSGSGDRPAAPRRAVRLLLVVVAIGALTVAIVTAVNAPSGSAPGSGLGVPSAVRALRGLVIAQGPGGTFALSRPDGSHRAAVPKRPLAPADNALVVGSGGQVVAVAPGRVPSPVLAPGAPVIASGASAPEPLADGGKAIVVVGRPSGPGFLSSVSVVTIAGDRSISLGTADSAAGDPAALGAFVAVVATLQRHISRPGQGGVLSDSRVELRDEGHPPVALADAAALNQAVHEDPGLRVNLGLFPDHDGGKVAVVLNPTGGAESNAAVVILDRGGRVVGSIGSGSGPIQYTPVYWSPDNTSLAFSSFDSVGVTLTVVDSRYETTGQGFETPTSVNGCTWSPDSSWLLCLATSPAIDDWVIARNDRALSPIYSIPGRGVPVAWLP